MRKTRRPGRPAGTRTRYREIATDIANKITSGELPVGKPLPTWEALAESYNVGPMTIGQAIRVLKEDGFIDASPRRRPVARLGQSLSGMMAQSIGVVMHTFLDCIIRPKDNDWTGAMLLGITKGAMAPPVTIVTVQGPQWRKEFPAGLLQLPLDGVLLLACPLKPDLLAQYQALQARFPVVSLDQPVEHLHSVTLDNVGAVRDATLKLIALGHRRIAFIRPFRNSPEVQNIDSNARQRTEAFNTACKKAGLAADDFKIFSSSVSDSHNPSIRELVRATPRFSGVVALDHGAQVEEEAKLAGLRVPRDLSIVSISQRLPSRWSGPVVSFEDFGAAGVKLIRSKPRSLQHVLIPTTWNDGETAAPPRD